MKLLGNTLSLVGLVVFGVAAVMRRVLKPEDLVNIGINRTTILAIMIIGAVLLACGFWIRRIGRKQ